MYGFFNNLLHVHQLITITIEDLNLTMDIYVFKSKTRL